MPATTMQNSLTGSIRSPVPLRLGARGDQLPFTGALDDLAIFDRRLTDEDLKRLASGKPPGGEGDRPGADPAASDRLRFPFTAADVERARKTWADRTRQPEMVVHKADGQMILIPPGEFPMGTNESREELGKPFNMPADAFRDAWEHKVTFTKPIYVGVNEVTRGQFSKFVADAKYRTDAERSGKGGWGFNPKTGKLFEGQSPKFTWKSAGFTPYDDTHPVINVSYNDAAAFCNWLSALEGLPACYRMDAAGAATFTGNGGYRLPTEAEAEYSARAGVAGRYTTGDDPAAVARAGNVVDVTYRDRLGSSNAISASDGWVFTAPVGSFAPNNFGLYDTAGNVWEWSNDVFVPANDLRADAVDPTGPSTGAERVIRGAGSWNCVPIFFRVTARGTGPANTPHADIGFRVARTVNPKP